MKPRALALLVLGLAFGLLLGASLCWLAPVIPADAQGVGIFGTSATGTRTNCTQITSPVVGQTVCFDQAANTWKVYTGASTTAAQWVGATATQSGVNNVRDFGAKGDGVTDDAPAIQTALTACFNAGGGIVYAPRGTYGLGSGSAGPDGATIALLIQSNCALVGAGIDATTFKTLASATSLTPIATPTGLGVNSNITLRDFTVDGNKTNVAVGAASTHEGSQSNLYMDQITDVLIDHVKSVNAISNALYSVNSSNRVFIRSSIFRDPGKAGATSGRGISINISPTLYQILGNAITGARDQGIVFQNEGGSDSADNVIADNVIQGNGSWGLDITDNQINSGTLSNRLSHRMSVANNVIQGSTANGGVRVSENTVANGGGFVAVAQNIQFVGNVIDGHTGVGVQFSVSNNGIVRNLSLIGNQIRNNTGNGVTIGAGVTDTFIDGNLIAGNGATISDSGTRTIQGVNKSDLTGAATIFGTITSGATLTYDGTTLISAGGNAVFGAAARTALNENFRWRVGTDQNLTARSASSRFRLEALNDAAGADVPLDFSATDYNFQAGGIQVNSPAGGQKGAGTINASVGLWVNGTQTVWNGSLTNTPLCTNNCGTAPSIAGTNTAMRVTMGATGTPATPFLVLFNGTWNATPACIAQIDTPGTTSATVTRANASTTGVLINTVVNPPVGAVYSIHCLGVG